MPGHQVVMVSPQHGEAYPQQGAHPQQARVVAMGMPPTDDKGAEYLAFQDKEVRKGFITKVYGILMVQLSFTALVVMYCTFDEKAGEYVRTHPNVYNAAWFLSLVMFISLACCSSVRRNFPMNYIALGLFTVLEAYLLGVVAAFYQTESVMVAMVGTVVVTGSLIAYAHTTKSDFTMHGGVLTAGVVVLLVCGIFFFFFPTRLGMILLGGFAAMLFCAFIVYDVQVRHRCVDRERGMFASNHRDCRQ